MSTYYSPTPSWPTFNPGVLRFLGTIEGTSPSRNLDGSTKNEWGTFAAEVRFGFLTQHSREFFQAQQMTPEITMEIVMRYLPGVTAKMRMSFGSRRLEFKAPPVNVEERNLWLVIFCRELV